MDEITTAEDIDHRRRAIFGDEVVPQALPIVFVVHDDASLRESLEALIFNEGWQVETFASAQEFLSRPRVLAPSCLVLDVALPDLNGLELQRRIVVDRLDMAIIFITRYCDVRTTVQAMKAGAVEFLTKPFADDVVLSAIRQAIERSRCALGREAELQALRACHASLSRREREVMALVVSGLLNKQVGHELGISEITVKAHRGRVMQKMKAKSFADLINMNARTSPNKLRVGESRQWREGSGKRMRRRAMQVEAIQAPATSTIASANACGAS